MGSSVAKAGCQGGEGFDVAPEGLGDANAACPWTSERDSCRALKSPAEPGMATEMKRGFPRCDCATSFG